MGNVRSKELHLHLNTIVEQSEADKFKDLSLSQKAIIFINSIDAISCTLLGMRQEKYVDDAIQSLKASKLESAVKKWEKLK